MSDPVCENCQRPIPADAPGGACPACLLGHGLADPSLRTSTVGPGSTLSGSEVPESALSAELPGRYTLLESSGQGGMGKVYLVRDAQLGRDVALKELLPREAVDASGDDTGARVALARFTREARVTAQLQHPAITPVYELGRRADGSYYYTMKYVRGRTLAAALKEAKSIEERMRLLPHFVALCHAIAFAHSRGVIHRDVKPANVMIGDFGETVVVDWGLAKMQGVVDAGPRAPEAADATAEVAPDDGLQTLHGTALGTPAYMPPEQAQGLIGSLDQRADIYSLGAVLYEILSGKRPFSGASAREVLAEVLTKAPPPLLRLDPAIPPEYAAICERAMSREAARRHASASELAAEIQDVRLRPPKGAVRWLLERAALVVLASGIAGLIAVHLWSEREVARARTRIVAKGFDLRPNPEDFTSFGRSDIPLPAGARHAAGALYGLTWEFPDLGDRDSALSKRVAELSVRDATFPWPRGSEPERKARQLQADAAPVVEAIRAIARLPRGGGRAVTKKAFAQAETPFSVEIPSVAAFGAGTTLLAHTAHLARVDGRHDEALAAATAGIRFAGHLEDVPFLMGLLVRAIAVQNALRPIEGLELAGIPEASLVELESALREGALGPAMPAAIESETRGGLYAFHLVRTGRVSGVALALAGSPGDLPPLLWAVYGRGPLSFWANWDESLFLALMTDSLEATRRPPHEALPDLRRIADEHDALANRMHPLLGVVPKFRSAVVRCAEIDAAMGHARTRVALERFRRARGTHPDSLQELVPNWLDAVPVHVPTGAPLGYRRTGTAYELSMPAPAAARR